MHASHRDMSQAVGTEHDFAPMGEGKVFQPQIGKRSAKDKAADELHLRPLELIARLAALDPPPRTHRQRYFGVLAPNWTHRSAAVAREKGAAVQPPQPAQVQAAPASTGAGTLGVSNPLPPQTEPAQPVPPKCPAHYLWTVLIARIYEVFPLLCSMCGGRMRITSAHHAQR